MQRHAVEKSLSVNLETIWTRGAVCLFFQDSGSEAEGDRAVCVFTVFILQSVS